MLNQAQLFDQTINPKTSATIRTLVEQSRLTTGLPTVKELPWLRPTETPSDATIVTDPNHDFIPKGQSFVRSDTGELVRDWKQGIQTIDTPKTQAVAGWIGGKTLELSEATIQIDTRKAVVALTSIDEQPLSSSRHILITAMARAIPRTPRLLPYLSEPVVGTITLRTKTDGLQFVGAQLPWTGSATPGPTTYVEWINHPSTDRAGDPLVRTQDQSAREARNGHSVPNAHQVKRC